MFEFFKKLDPRNNWGGKGREVKIDEELWMRVWEIIPEATSLTAFFAKATPKRGTDGKSLMLEFLMGDRGEPIVAVYTIPTDGSAIDLSRPEDFVNLKRNGLGLFKGRRIEYVEDPYNTKARRT